MSLSYSAMLLLSFSCSLCRDVMYSSGEKRHRSATILQVVEPYAEQNIIFFLPRDAIYRYK